MLDWIDERMLVTRDSTGGGCCELHLDRTVGYTDFLSNAGCRVNFRALEFLTLLRKSSVEMSQKHNGADGYSKSHFLLPSVGRFYIGGH